MSSLMLLVALLAPPSSGAAILEKSAGSTSFLAIGRPAAIKIKGQGEGPEGEIQLKSADERIALSGELRVDLDTLGTGIGLRDRHMKEKYLETNSYKLAKLRIKDALLPANFRSSGSEVTVPASLELHGIEKPVTVTITFATDKERVNAKSKFKIKLSDFAVPVPSFSGITVADEVEVAVDSSVAADALAVTK